MNTQIKTFLKYFMGDIGMNNEYNRVQWLKQTLSKVPKGSRILDAGAGPQPFKHLCSHLIYVAQDFGKYDGVGNNKGLQTGDFDYGTLNIISDISDIPEPDGSFDAIMCTEVLEHIPQPELAIEEFARLLRSGGHLILTAPFCSLTHFAPYHYVTGFNRYFYEYLLSKYGFEIIEIQKSGSFFDYLAQEIRRLDSVARKYTGSGLTLVDKSGVFIMLLTLRRLRTKDSGSSELLCYGYHIHAIKK